MGILNIAPVRRNSAKIVLALAGVTGEGKTYSALQLAYGLANMDHEKVGFLDTESGRGSWYDTIYGEGKPFQYCQLEAPFSPDRYAEAMREFSATGIDVIVIDSLSHEHEGFGGMEDIANAKNGRVPDWITAKRLHKGMMNTLLSLPCHVIICLRAREKSDFKNPKDIKSLGIQPITEKNVMFDVTASFMMWDKGNTHEPIKLPEGLKPMLGQPGYFRPEHGKMLRDYLGGQDPLECAKNVLRLAAGEGSEALKNAWIGTDKALKLKLESFKDTLKPMAAASDAERIEVRGDNGEPE